jgi:hypothetical protein
MIQTPRSGQQNSSVFFYLTLLFLWVAPGLVFAASAILAGGQPHTRIIDWPFVAIRSLVRGGGRILPWEWVGAPIVRSTATFYGVALFITVPVLVGIVIAMVTLRGGIPAVFPFLSLPRLRSRWANPRTLVRSGLVVAGGNGRRIVLGRHRGHLVAAREGTPVLAFGASGSGKTASLCIPTIGEWEGSVVAVSDGTDLAVTTAGLRQEHGRVDVLDVSGRSGLATCTWSPAGPPLTFDEAMALVAQVLEGREPSPDEPTRQILTCVLYAAANQGLGAAAAVGWLDDMTGATLVRSLLHVADRDSRATSLASRIVERERDERAASFSAARQLLRAHFEQAAPGAVGRAFQPSEFLANPGSTLYVVTPSERVPGSRVEPLLRTLVMGADERQPRRPLLVVLDGCAAVASMPDLAEHLSTRSSSVVVLATMRDPDECGVQAGADLRSLADHALAVMFLGGGGEGSEAGAPSLMSRLVQRQLALRRRLRVRPGWDELAPDLLPPDAARQLGLGRALLVQERMAPAVLWTRNCYEDLELQQLHREHPFVRGVQRIHQAS